MMVAIYASSLSIDLSPPGHEVVAKKIEKETWRKEEDERNEQKRRASEEESRKKEAIDTSRQINFV